MTPRSVSDVHAPVATSHPTLGAEAQKFGRSATVYVAASLLLRGMTVLLTPIYTRAMGPGDFAVISVANAIAAVLTIVFSLSLNSCIPRLSLEYGDTERPTFFGTLLVLSVVAPLLLVALLTALGTGGYLELFQAVHFRPHLELAIWASFFAVFMPLPLMVYTSREQPGKAALLSGSTAILQLVFTLLLVAWLHQGAIGVLRANLLSTAVTGVVSIGLMARMAAPSFSLLGIRRALAFSLPLVPHLVANWALAISDRLILDRHVSTADVGRYSLGYTFGTLVSTIAAAVASALSPMAYRQLKDPVQAKHVPPLGTYALLVVVGFALVVALGAPDVVALIAPPSYAGATAFVPWVILGAVFQGLYFVLSTGTWFSMNTKPVALITVAGAALNIAINLVYVPKYGAMAAAISTAVAYGVSALMHGALAHRLFPIAWEYHRLAIMFVLALLWYAAAMHLAVDGAVLRLALKSAIAFVGFPVSLAACRFFSAAELSRVLQLATRGRTPGSG